MEIMVYAPGCSEYQIVNVENTLSALQELVGGYIETMSLTNKCVALFDEEGRISGKEYSVTLLPRGGRPVRIVGTCVICGIRGSNFGDVDIEHASKYCRVEAV